MAWLMLGVAAWLAAAMALAWLVQRVTGNGGWVDAVWSFATGIGAAAAALWPLDGQAPTLRAWLAALLIGAWALRLGGYITARSLGAKHEDPRYARLREAWGARFEPLVFGFLQVQAACSVALALAVMVAARNPAPGLAWSDVIAVLICLAAVVGEGIADGQMQRFRSDPANKGKVCEDGLWGVSRHPNYFFEWTFWLAWPVMAIGPAGGWTAGFLALLAPVLMFWLLRYGSGVPPLEAAMLKSRGALFSDYQARVSPFVPLPPRRDGAPARTTHA
jgi:steroid 5-alpha reductase family enzyme